MATRVSSSVRRRPDTPLPHQPSMDVMLRTIKRWDPLKYAALVEAATHVYTRLLAERRNGSNQL